MKRNLKKPRQGGLYRHESAYSLELARGASHIASMLSAATQEAAVREVVQEFVAAHGTPTLDAFCWLLAERLEKRGCTAGATQARGFGAALPRARTGLCGLSRGPLMPLSDPCA